MASLTQEQATQFVYSIFITMWQAGRADLIDYYYPEDVVVHTDGKQYNRDDIRNRMSYNIARYRNRKNVINEVIVVDQLIVARIRQSAYDIILDSPSNIPMVVVYRPDGHRAQEVWIMTEIDWCYEAKFSELDLDELTEKASHWENQRKRFYQMVKDFKYINKGQSVDLTERELECLFYLVNGFQAKEVASILTLSSRTIEDYFASIKRKFGCSKRSDLRRIFYSGGCL